MLLNRRQFLSRSTLGLAAASFVNSPVVDLPLARCAEKVGAMPDYGSTRVRLIQSSTATFDGFRFPAEWESHERCIMVFPPPQNWLGYDILIEKVHRQWADVANTLCEFEPVLMVIRREERAVAKRLLSRKIEIVELSVNDGWSRDSGPMFIVNEKRERRIAGFTFNGWGGKFPPFADDALLKARLGHHFETPMYPIDLVLEGGAVTVDGEGTVITTEQCLLHANRNDGRTRKQVEDLLNSALGTSKVIWLKKGLEPDPVTDGHVDGIACYAAPGVVLLHTTDDRSDENHAICNDARQRLNDARDANGRKLKVVEVPLTSDDVAHMNFYIGNGCVLVPTSGRRAEDQAPLAILRETFPKHKVIGIESTVLAKGGGGIHCITQQVPKSGA